MARKTKSDTAPQAADKDQVADAAEALLAFEQDILFEGEAPDDGLPQSEDEFFARDPFSADYVMFRRGQAELRRVKRARVNEQLRSDMLERPHLMEKPAEAGNRGAAAVWRSLRDLLRSETETLIDSSSLEELMLLKRELEARKAIVEAVNAGLLQQLKRLEQRLSVHDPEDTQIMPANISIKTR